MEYYRIINIIKSVLNQKKFEPDENFEKIDFAKLYAFSKVHHLAAFVACCPAALEKMPAEIRQKFRYEMNINIAKETAQTVQIGAFLEKMEQAGLRAMPLKGYFLKNLYPVPALRYMTDTDILVDEEKLDEIRSIMESLGFRYDHDTLHESIYMSPQLVVELHKTLIPSNMGKIYDYYGDFWKFAKVCPQKKFIYEFSKEDLYVFTIGHIAKHYVGGGIGITHVIDVFLQNKQELDWEYIKTELRKLGIESFHKIITTVADMWFSEEAVQHSVDAVEMARFILSSGSFGNDTNRTSAKLNRSAEAAGKEDASRIGVVLKLIFPSVNHIKLLYPSVRKCILLYPICVVARIFKICFFRRKEIGKLSTVMNTNKDDMDFFKNHCEKMGLSKDL